MNFLIGALIIVAIIAVKVHRGLQMKNLAHDGVVAEGEVVEKFKRARSRSGGASPYLRYEFYTFNGLRYESMCLHCGS